MFLNVLLWIRGHQTGFYRFVSISSGALALLSLLLAAVHIFGGECVPSKFAKLIVAGWVLGPPLWLWFEWFFIAKGRVALPEFEHGQSVVRALWVALVAVLAAAFGLVGK